MVADFSGSAGYGAKVGLQQAVTRYYEPEDVRQSTGDPQ
jgi:hypothetical protein